MTEKWKYYNHALIPTTEPHEEISFDKSIFKGTKAILARWTSEFHCGKETNWWYVIKDTPV